MPDAHDRVFIYLGARLHGGVATVRGMEDTLLEWYGPIAAALTLSAVWMAEAVGSLWPRGRDPLGHGARNLALGLINGAVRALFVPGLLIGVCGAAHAAGFGLLHWLPWAWWAELIVAVLLLDLLSYAWHVLSHHAPVLWRLHAVHHHDAEMDATTAFRFHFGDIAATSLSLLAAAPLLGLEVVHVLIYEVIAVSASIFHHANVRLPGRVERLLRWVIVTPAMHVVHHSRWHVETDSNFSTVFPVWDRLFGTYRRARDPGAIRPGLDGFRPEEHSTVLGMLAMPLSASRSEPGDRRGSRVGREPRQDGAVTSVAPAATAQPADFTITPHARASQRPHRSPAA